MIGKIFSPALECCLTIEIIAILKQHGVDIG